MVAVALDVVQERWLHGRSHNPAGEVGKKAADKGVTSVVFDRGGFRYHGVVKAFADSARESGLKF